jgi:RNA polymerase sigma factor (TIGR02999 family)
MSPQGTRDNEANPLGPAAPAIEVRPGDELFDKLYAELRRLADRELHRGAVLALSPTTLVHEAYINMAERPDVSFADRARFLAYAARVMRGLIIDFARNRRALKRGAGFHITRLDTHVADGVADERELSRISDALDAMAELDPRLAEVIDLKYFCGFSFADIAHMQGTSERTVQRDWEKARLFLFEQLQGASQP